MCAEFEQHIPALRGWTEVLAQWPQDGGEEPIPQRHYPRDTVLTLDSEGPRARNWSLVPSWAEQARLSYATFNARAETLRDKPVFRQAWSRGQRCLVPVTRYYEWGVVDGHKRKHRITPADGKPLALAGLWDVWTGEDAELHSCTVVTIAASPAMARWHARMPLMLGAGQAQRWLDGALAEAETLLSIQPEPAVEVETEPRPPSPQMSLI